MADQGYYIKKGQTTPLIVAGLMGVGGVVLIVYAIAKGGGAPRPPTNPLEPGEAMGEPSTPTLELEGQISIRRGDRFAVLAPTVPYRGSGRDTYSQFSIKQQQGGQWVTVYASGVAGVHVGPSPSLASWDLVSPDQPQPTGCPGQSLCAFPFPGVGPNPICGAPAQQGVASAYVEVFERKYAQDADGFASPTCNGRIPVSVRMWPNKFIFT